MPDGRTHTSVTLLTTAYASAFLADKVVNWGWAPESLLVVAGCLAGVLLTPDLDLNGRNVGNAIIRRRLGPVLEFLWFIYWRPYSLLVPHRSWVSHFPVLSTVVRFAYALWWVLLIPGVNQYFHQLAWSFVGLALVDLNHIFLDFVRPDDRR